MICHLHKCIFVHIPKNAGQSIEHVFLGLSGLTWETRAPLLLRQNDNPELGPPRLAHLKANEYTRHGYITKEQYNSYFKFSIVRNPWDRMVSIYKYSGYSNIVGFKEYLFGDFIKKDWKKRSWFVGPQFEYLYADNGEIIVDYVGRFETLQKDFDYVCEKIGIQHIDIPHVNRSGDKQRRSIMDVGLEITVVSQNVANEYSEKFAPAHYVEYYDRESNELVAELYKKDIELFGYHFECEILNK